MGLLFSDAAPLQFWKAGQTTYNNALYPNIQQFPYFHQWLPGDEIMVPTSEKSTGYPKDYRLSIQKDGSEIGSVDFVRTTNTKAAAIDNNPTNYSIIPTNADWNLTTKAVVLNNTSNLNSKYLTYPIIQGLANREIRLIIPYTIGFGVVGVDPVITPFYTIWNADKTQSVGIIGTPRNAAGTYYDHIKFTPDFVPAFFGMQYEYTYVASGRTVLVTAISPFPVITSVYYYDSGYLTSFIPADYGLEEDCIELKVYEKATAFLLSDSMSNVAYNWEQGALTAPLANNLWAQDTGAIKSKVFRAASVTYNTLVEYRDVVISEGDNVKFTILWLLANYAEVTNKYFLVAHLMKDGNIVDSKIISEHDGANSGFSESAELTFKSDFDCDQVGFQIQLDASVDTFDINCFISDVNIQQADTDLDSITDELEITPYPENNVLILYKSSKDFAGIKYTEASDYLRIRIIGTLFHAANIMEIATVETTTKVFNNATALRKEKWFHIEDTPEYMQDKIALILMHATSGTLQINGVEWGISSPLEDDGDRPGSYPMKAKQCKLIRKNFDYRNVI